MTICSNRTERPGPLVSCWEASGRKGCACGLQVEAEAANPRQTREVAAGSHARPGVDQNHIDGIPGRQIEGERQ